MYSRMARGLILMLLGRMLKPIYKIYEKWLWLQIRDGVKPKHIAIIPDGNRRWARSKGLNPSTGHYFGYEKMKDVLKWCLELGVEVVTIYALSIENFKKRSRRELEELMKLFERGIRDLLGSGIIHEYKVKVKLIGKEEVLPEKLRNLIREVEVKTRNYNDKFLNIAIGYSGREEIVNAVRKIVEDARAGRLRVEDIDEETFSKYLYTGDLPHPDPDLIIRTSGEERLSGFLLWQSAYSELYFCDVYWPDFRKIDFWRAIRSFQSRERRFGR